MVHVSYLPACVFALCYQITRPTNDELIWFKKVLLKACIS